MQLLPDYRCALFGKPERPAICVSLRPTEEMCGTCRDQAMASLTELERLTAPQAEARGRLRPVSGSRESAR
jgi:hypothetical protein